MENNRGIQSFLNSEKAIFVLMLLALAERLIMFFWLGSGRLCDSDDIAYVQSGITFARTGVISVWSSLPTAKIMPGLPVVAGLLCRIFGEGKEYIDAVRLLWIVLGCLTPYVIYKASCLFLPSPYALFAAAGFLLPNWAWSDNTVLTETPYLLFYCLCLYCTLLLGQENGEKSGKAVAGFALSFMGALMFRANILLYLPFALAYLFFVARKSLRQVARPMAALVLAMAVFVIPWSIRNYRLFGEFIPISSGTANPTLLGTYQGETAPRDETLDYETHVYAPVRAEFPDAFDENGQLIRHELGEKISERTERLQTRYRLREWWNRDPWGLIWAYFFSKPACMLNWVWIWLPLPWLYYTLRFLSQINLVMCVGAALLSLIQKKNRAMLLWLGSTYVINIYIIAMSFASERYAGMFMPLRYMLAAMGLQLAVSWLQERKKTASVSG